MKAKIITALFSFFFLWNLTAHIDNRPVLNWLEDQFNYVSSHKQAEKVYLHLDRTLYQPGEQIWFSAYIRNAQDHTTEGASGVLYVHLLDGKEKILQQQEIIALNGNASGTFKLAKNMAGGLYKIKAFTNWNKNFGTNFTREVMVQKAVLPKLNMQLDFEKEAYGPNDLVKADFEVKNLENYALPNHSIEYEVQLEGKVHLRKKLMTDKEGKAKITFQLPQELHSVDGRLNILVPYRGQVESKAKSVPIVLNKIDLQFLPEGGTLLERTTNSVAFKAINEFGKPADIQGIIYNKKGKEIQTFTSYHDGMGKFNLATNKKEPFYAMITKPTGISDTFWLPAIENTGATLQVQQISKNQIQGTVQSTIGQPLILLLHSGDQILYQEKVPARNSYKFTIPTETASIGISRLMLLDGNRNLISERLVFLNKHKQLVIDIQTDKETYLPREQVQVQISVKDGEGKPVKGAFSLAAVDEKLLSFADDKQGHILSSILLEQELKGEIHEPNFYFEEEKEKADQAIDLLMLTHGWRKYDWERLNTDNWQEMAFAKEQLQIAGMITDSLGNALAGAKVQLLESQYDTFTDSLGRFILDQVSLNRNGFILKVEKEGHPTVRRAVGQYTNQLNLAMANGMGVLKLQFPKAIQKEKGQYKIMVKKNGRIERQISDTLLSNRILHGLEPGHYFVDIYNGQGFIQRGATVNVEPNLQVNYYFKQLKFPEPIVNTYKDFRQQNFNFKMVSEADKIVEESGSPEMPEDLSILRDVEESIELDEVVVVEYKAPLIEQDNTTQGRIITGEDIQVLPVRNINALAATAAGVSSADEGDPISIRGSRSNSTDYFVDGIRVSGNLIPDASIAQIQVLTGGVPASLGGGMIELEQVEERQLRKFEVNGNIEGPPPAKVPGANSAISYAQGTGGLSRMLQSNPRIHRVVDQAARPIFKVCETLTDPKKRQACATTTLRDQLLDKLSIGHKNWMLMNGSMTIDVQVNNQGFVTSVEPAFVEKPQHYYLRWGTNNILRNQVNWIPGKKKSRNVNSIYSLEVPIEGLGQSNPRYYAPSPKFYAPKYTRAQREVQRTDFRSTVFWTADVQTDSEGKASLTFWNCDDLTTYRISMEGFGQNGEIGRHTVNYTTQKPFSLSAKLPKQVLTGDEIRIPVTLNNASKKTIRGKLNVSVPNDFESCNAWNKDLAIEAGRFKTLYLDYCVKSNLEQLNSGIQKSIQISFSSPNFVDKLKEQIEIENIGFPIEQVFSGKSLENQFEISIDHLIPGTLKGRFLAHPNPVSETLGSVERMIRQPSGCFEQTSSSTYPNVLAARLLQKLGGSTAELNKKLNQYIDKGYKRLINYEVSGGGFDWFGNEPAHEGLTAYGLMEFVDMQKVYPVPQPLIDRTSSWLLSRRDDNGGWKRSGRGLHSWGDKNEIWDAYIVWAVCEAGFGKDVQKELEKTYEDALSSKDPHLIALAANALLATGDQRGNQLVTRLVKQQEKDGSWHGKTHSITQSRGKNLQVETTALSILAILKSKDKHTSELEEGLLFLAKSKTPYGFGSTQATVLALKAIINYNTQSPDSQSDGIIDVIVDDKVVQSLGYRKNQVHPIVMEGLEKYLGKETHTIGLRFRATDKALPFELEVSYAAFQKKQDKACKVQLETYLMDTITNMGENIRYTAIVKNKQPTSLGYTTVVLGIPAGLSIQMEQLKALKTRKVIDHFELFGEKIALHLLNLEAGVSYSIPIDLKAEIPGRYTAPASSAYLYYENDLSSWANPITIEVLP